MKSFIIKFLCFGLLYLTVSLVITHFTPYHWGNPWFSTKIQFLEKNEQQQYNTFFFGSSRVYRQIDPKLFDSTFNSISQEKLSSFNLGAPATFNPQSFYLYEHFLNSALSKNAKYCFIDLMEVDVLSDFFMHEERTSYWQNSSDLLFVGKSIYHNNQLSKTKKAKSGLNYSVSYLENLLHLGHFGEQIMNPDYYDEKYVGVNKDGYFPLDEDYQTTDDKVMKDHLYDRKQRITENPELIQTRKQRILNSYKYISENYDKVNLQRILELIQKSKQRGVDLIFILSPRSGNQPLINLSQQIPEYNLMDFCNPEKNGSFYLYENSFDIGHFNTQGTELYSKMLALEFETKIRINGN